MTVALENFAEMIHLPADIHITGVRLEGNIIHIDLEGFEDRTFPAAESTPTYRTPVTEIPVTRDHSSCVSRNSRWDRKHRSACL